jgi:hypothetical protein
MAKDYKKMLRRIVMKRAIQVLILLLTAVFVTAPALANDLYVFPAKGQSQEQTERDKYDCYQWAKRQTGFDPMQAPTATSAPPQQTASTASPLRGAVGGAAVGAVVGGIARDDAGKGALAGAAGGALIGGMRRRNQAKSQYQAEQQWAQEQAGQYTQRRNEYNRAYAACLEGKGYTVK